MFKITIRNLQKEDKESIVSIFSLYWHDQEFLSKLVNRLDSAIESNSESLESGLKYFVAEKDNEVIGVLGLRKAPAHMLEFTVTENPAELYILAVKNKGEGIGKILVKKCIESAKEIGYTEAVLYSGETHKESWGFYDYLGFERIASATAPNGELGQIWRKLLI